MIQVKQTTLPPQAQSQAKGSGSVPLEKKKQNSAVTPERASAVQADSRLQEQRMQHAQEDNNHSCNSNNQADGPSEG
jgi:hypothetical protein